MRSSSSPPMFADNVLICIQIKEGVEVNAERWRYALESW